MLRYSETGLLKRQSATRTFLLILLTSFQKILPGCEELQPGAKLYAAVIAMIGFHVGAKYQQIATVFSDKHSIPSAHVYLDLVSIKQMEYLFPGPVRS